MASKNSAMVKWYRYQKSAPIVKDDIAPKIIEHLAKNMESYFQCINRPERTRFVKKELVKLGHKLGFRVYANGLTREDLKEIGVEFVNREWLFDLHWFTNGVEPYSVQSLPLVVECEWNPRRKGDSKTLYSGIKYDFQKLLIANADLRLMIFKIAKEQELELLGEYFNNSIQNYQHLNNGSKFLFIAYDLNMLCFHYAMIFKE